MADFEELSFSYLGLLSNAHHDGTTQQIDDCCGNYETDNATFLRKSQTLHQCRVKEDEAWKKSQVDPVVKQLQAADKRQDNYMSCFHSIISGYASLPEDEAQKAQAQSAKQVFKDFVFSINDGYGAEADKILQMGQNLQPLQEFLTTIGAWQWYVKAAQSAQTALANLEATEGDRLVYFEGFAEFDGEKWEPDITMKPGMGYMYKSAKDVSFAYSTATSEPAAGRLMLQEKAARSESSIKRILLKSRPRSQKTERDFFAAGPTFSSCEGR